MYDRIVQTPRLHKFYEEGEQVPLPFLVDAIEAVRSHYADSPGSDLRTTGLCMYRDGSDSVAWHSDSIGSYSNTESVIAILSLGAERRFLTKPTDGDGATLSIDVRSGDLLVMGGTFQRTQLHCVPKTRREVGSRISVQFRPSGIR